MFNNIKIGTGINPILILYEIFDMFRDFIFDDFKAVSRKKFFSSNAIFHLKSHDFDFT